MRIWSIHPKYLDGKRLIAVWRETLFARLVLQGKTKTYKNHPQLNRFKDIRNPLQMIDDYLHNILKESKKRKYNFNKSLIKKKQTKHKIKVTNKQLRYELDVLIKKRNYPKDLIKIKNPEPNSIFKVVKGKIESWEKIKYHQTL